MCTLARQAAVIVLALAAAIAGCSGVTRPPRPDSDLLQRRDNADDLFVSEARERFLTVLERNRREYDQFVAGQRPAAPVIDFLIVSGGGDWGAFGAGVLKGWGKVPASDPLAKPPFDIVTGVSTGALIAPFAFLGDDDSIDRILHLYRNPEKDLVKERWPLFFLPSNISFAEVPGLEREVREALSPEFVARVATRGGEGRVLAVNTTNLDLGVPRVFFLVPEAQNATATGDLTRLHNIILASAGIPGAFPYREIDGDMYVDGAVTANILYAGRLGEEDTLPAIWQQKYPGVPIPKIRYWVIFNNQLHTPPAVVRARWFDIITRSIDQASRSATLTKLRHLQATAEISRLKRHADVEVRIIAIPDRWRAPVEGTFVKQTMNDLADLGEKMGADPSSWIATPLNP
jgi:hypothetical protein